MFVTKIYCYFATLNKKENMRSNTNIRFLRATKIGFDIAIVFMSAVLVALIASVVFNISYFYSNSSLGAIFAQASPIQETVTNDFTLNSIEKDISVSYFVTSYDLVMQMKSNNISQIPIIYKLINLTALNLTLFFLIFVFFQASKILKSILRSLKQENKAVKNYLFNKKNIKRFQYIAYGFIGMPLIELIIYFSDYHFLSNYFSIPGHKLRPIIGLSSISWDYIFIGLLFISLIEIIRRGITIQEENDLTV